MKEGQQHVWSTWAELKDRERTDMGGHVGEVDYICSGRLYLLNAGASFNQLTEYRPLFPKDLGGHGLISNQFLHYNFSVVCVYVCMSVCTCVQTVQFHMLKMSFLFQDDYLEV